MSISEDIRRQLINSFKAEQKEYIQKITQGLLALEKQPAAETEQNLLNDIFRHAHSLKGGARAVGMSSIESMGHGIEDVLLAAKERRLQFSAEIFDLLYQTLDAIELIMERLNAGETKMPAKALALLAQLEEATTQPAAKPANTGPSTGNGMPPGLPPTKQLSLPQQDIAPDSIPAELPSAPTKTNNADAPKSSSANAQDETIRVSVSKLDALMEQLSELLGARIRAEQRLTEVKQAQSFAHEWQKSWQEMRRHYNKLLRDDSNGYNADAKALIDFVGQNQERLRTLVSQTNALYRRLSNDTMRMSLIVEELQEEIKRVRMLPLSTITASFGRMVRDLARAQNKEIEFMVVGAETEIDKRVLEKMKDPLIHLLRNSVDHGLEKPETRLKGGKPQQGMIILSASQQGSNIVITISDDGRGLDLEAIRQSAIRRGLLNAAEADKLNAAETANLIFYSGLSTNQIITDISGRGVGMDVVRQNVEELHGSLNVNFLPQQGTTFTLTLPLTLTSSRGLLVEAGRQIFALPHSTVERMLQVERSAITGINGKQAIMFQGKPVALAWLDQLLELPPSPNNSGSGYLLTDGLGIQSRALGLHQLQFNHHHNSNRVTIILVNVAEKRLGLVVDNLADEQEIIIKSLGKQLARVGGIAGATLMGSGKVVLVLHTADLVKLATRAKSRAALSEPGYTADLDRQKTILVVDDSVTTRTLEKNILEAAGYQVNTATNGEEALTAIVSKGIPDLIVSDINMPYLDGFGLTKRIKQDNRYQDIPIVLVTSLDSPADKARGIEIGADAYIVKGSFDQSNLLETIEQLV